MLDLSTVAFFPVLQNNEEPEVGICVHKISPGSKKDRHGWGHLWGFFGVVGCWGRQDSLCFVGFALSVAETQKGIHLKDQSGLSNFQFELQ